MFKKLAKKSFLSCISTGEYITPPFYAQIDREGVILDGFIIFKFEMCGLIYEAMLNERNMHIYIDCDAIDLFEDMSDSFSENEKIDLIQSIKRQIM